MHTQRLVRDYERLPQHTEAMFTIAAIALMSRRLTRQPARLDAPKPLPDIPLPAA